MPGSIAQISRTDLDGVPVVFAPQPANSPFLAQLVFRVGVCDETLPLRGITHLVEHLALPVSFEPPVEFNAVVSGTLTHFWFSGPRDPVLHLLERTIGALAKPPPERLELERELLLAEAETRAQGTLQAALGLRFGASGHGLSGNDEIGLPRFTRNDVHGWAAERFNRGNMALAFSGELPSELEIALPDGKRHEPPPAQPIADLKTPAVFSHSHEGGVWTTLISERTTAANAAMWAVRRRLYDRLRGRRVGLSYGVELDRVPLTRRDMHEFIHADCLEPNQEAVAATLVATLDELAANGPKPEDLEEYAGERERDDRDDSYLSGALFWYASRAAFGEPFQSPAELTAEVRGLTPEQVAGALRSALPTLLLGISPSATVPGGRFAPYPLDSPRRVEGRRYRRSGLPVPGRARQGSERELIVGDSGVTLVGEDYVHTVLFDETAAAVSFGDGSLELHGLDGHRIFIDPAIWRRSGNLIETIERGIPKQLIVDLGDETSIFDDPDLAAAHEAFEQEEWTQAIPLFSSGLEREPGDHRAWALLAAAHYNNLDRTAAIESARRAVELAPDDAYPRRLLATALLEAGHGEEALEQTRTLLELEPGDLQTMVTAVFQLVDAGFEREALDVANRAVELFPDVMDSYDAHGWAAQALGDFAQARASLERSVAMEPKLSMAHNNLGWVLLQDGDLEQALVCFDRALELDADNIYAGGNRPRALWLLGRTDEAAQARRASHTAWLEKQQEALELDPRDADALWRAPFSLWHLGREREALDAAREAARRLPGDALLRRSLALMELVSGNAAESAAAAEGALDLDDASFDAMAFAAWYGAYSGSERVRASAAAECAIAQRPDGTCAWATAGYGAVADGGFADGIAWFDKVIQRSPIDCCAFAGRGLARLSNGDQTGARDDLDRAILFSGDSCLDARLLRAKL